MDVATPAGDVIGIIQAEATFCGQDFTVRDGSGNIILRLEQPLCATFCCSEELTRFRIISASSGQDIGKITQLVRTNCGQTFSLRLRFPIDLDVNVKAILLAMTLLIDFVKMNH